MRVRSIKYPNLKAALAVDSRPQYIIASEAGLSPSVLSAIISGRVTVSLRQRDAISAAVGIDPKRLFSES